MIRERDRVKLSQKALENFQGSFKEFMKKHVYEVREVQVSIMQGVKYKLHCGTTVSSDEVELVEKSTPLFT